MADKLLQTFQLVGRPIALAGTEPLRLDGDRAWIVLSGKVELYSIELAGGVAAGGRRFLHCAEVGELVVGIGGDDGQALLAIGLDAQLAELDDGRLTAVLRSAAHIGHAEVAIDRWLTSLTSVVEVERASGQLDPLEVGVELQLPTDEIVAAGGDVCWVTLINGEARVYGRGDLRLEQGMPFPLVRGGWLQSVGEGSRVRTATTRSLIKNGRCMAAARGAVRRLCGALRADVRAQDAVERRRLRAKAERDRDHLSHAYMELREVLANQEVGQGGSDNRPPLITAFREVARAVGIDLRPGLAMSGAVATSVAALSEATRVRVRRVRLSGRWWRDDNGPLLGFLGADERPVALIRTAAGYQLRDPVDGARRSVDRGVAGSLRRHGYMLMPSLGERRLTLRRLWLHSMRPYLAEARLVLLATVVSSVLALATPIVSKVLFDDVIPQSARGQLPVVIGGLAIITVVNALFSILRGRVQLRLQSKLEMNMEAAVMDRLLRLPSLFFARFNAGDLRQRVMAFATLRGQLTGPAIGILLTGTFSFVNLGVILAFEPSLVALALVLAAIGLVVLIASNVIAIHFGRLRQERDGAIQGFLPQLLRAISKLRVAAAEARSFGMWATDYAELRRLEYEQAKVTSYFSVYQTTFPVVSSMLFFVAIYMAAPPSTGAGLTTGAFVAVTAAFSQFLAGLLGMGGTLLSLTSMIPILERIRPILDEMPEVSGDSADPGQIEGDLRVSQVTFRHGADGPLILDGVSLHARTGEMVALVGRSGSGKSTLVRLILGLWKPTSGSIHIDGRDLTALDAGAIRRQIGVVPQDARLLHGTVLTTILGEVSTLGVKDAWEAARLAGIEDFIQSLPMGMYTPVSEGGSTFSGGQRQRLLIARALARRPRVLILDEATSALDNSTQKLITKRLAELRITRLIIAHRLSTIRDADRIFVLDGGKIVEQGGFDELMAMNGHFAALARRQIL